jgi:chemotaxis protein MotB
MHRMNGRMMVKGSMVVGALLALSGMTGCLSQGEYDRVAEAYNSCKARTAELERERDEARISLSQLQSSMGQGEGTLSSLTARNAELERQLAQARGDLQGFEGKLSQISFGPIDAVTSNELERLAQQFPNLISFDAERGMLRVASDLTFASGSTVVNENAKQALSRLADILKSGSAAQYDVIVEGHTDSQRIGSATTRQHSPSNRHLSTNRANAVIETLASMGVPNNRLMAAGWGEYRPSMTNSANGNTPGNRRVELYLAKLSSGNSAATTPGNSGNDVVTPAPRPAPAPDNIK